MIRILVGTILVIGLTAFAVAPPPVDPIAEYIDRLGSDDFQSREESAKQLRKTPGVEPYLRKASRSSDPEVATRAKQILAEVLQRQLPELRTQLKADARAGKADLLMERIVSWPGPNDDPACWQSLIDLMWIARNYEKRSFKRITDNQFHLRMLHHSFPVYLHRQMASVAPLAEKIVVPGARMAPNEFSNALFVRGRQMEFHPRDTGGFFVASDSIEANSVLGYLLLVGQSVEIRDGGELAIFCAGDVTIKRRLTQSIIIAKGNVTCLDDSITRSVVLAGGDIHFKGIDIYDSTLKTAGKVHYPKAYRKRNLKVEEGAKEVFGPIRFFSPADVGVTTNEVNGRLLIDSLKKDTPFAQAGLQVGDRILALDGNAVATSAAFCHVLRKCVVNGGFTVLRYSRRNEIATVRIVFSK